MGIELTYQALPYPCSLLDAAKKDVELWNEIICLAIPWNNLDEDKDLYDDVSKLPQVQELLKIMPRPSDWSLYQGSRSQDKLRWLLSNEIERGMDYEEYKDSFVFKVIYGESKIANKLVASQGIPLRISTPDFVKSASQYLQGLDFVYLEKRFDQESMSKSKVYKAHGFDQFKHLKDDLISLSLFYEKVAKKGYQVIVEED